MVEYHGWVTVRAALGDEGERRTNVIFEDIQRTVACFQADHRVLGAKVVNATHIVWMSGCTNHWSSDIEEVFSLIHEIARLAPASYGLLYVWNDEGDRENVFRVLRIAHGTVTEHEDTLLSPCIPQIEDELQ